MQKILYVNPEKILRIVLIVLIKKQGTNMIHEGAG